MFASALSIRVRAFVLLAFLGFLVATASSPSVVALPDAPPSALERQVADWVRELSRQPAFAGWEKASRDVSPLGPGTHGWLVVLSEGNQPVGYLVVHAAEGEEGAFRLGEYGVGPDVLLSPSTLARSLRENGLTNAGSDGAAVVEPITTIRHYAHPFAAAWEVRIGTDTYWIDAKTGETIPIGRFEPKAATGLHAGVSASERDATTIAGTALRETFDPYERLPWLLGEAPFSTRDTANMQSRIRSGLHLRYVTEPYGDAMLYAVPVVGYQRWTSGRIDIALDMGGTRYVPLETLARTGKFYR